MNKVHLAEPEWMASLKAKQGHNQNQEAQEEHTMEKDSALSFHFIENNGDPQRGTVWAT